MRRPTALELCEVYSANYPDKINNLRPDSLALLLNMANVNCYSKVLLVDSTKGFLSGALLEKQVDSVLKIEVGGEQLKLQIEILLEYGFH